MQSQDLKCNICLPCSLCCSLGFNQLGQQWLSDYFYLGDRKSARFVRQLEPREIVRGWCRNIVRVRRNVMANMTNISRPRWHNKQNTKSSPHHTTPSPSHQITSDSRILYRLVDTYMIFSVVETWCHCLSFLQEQKYKLNFQEVLRGASSHSVWRTTPSLRECSLENPPKPSNGWESGLLSVHPSVASVSAPDGAVFKGELNVSRVYRAG